MKGMMKVDPIRRVAGSGTGRSYVSAQKLPRHQARLATLMMRVTRKITRNTKNRSFASPADATATPVKPKIAARIAMTKKVKAQPSMLVDDLRSPTLQLCGQPIQVRSGQIMMDSKVLHYLAGTAMASTIWKGYLSFGLISVPIRLFAAARPERVSFHMLHGVCSTRVKQQLFCPHCERVVERSEIVKGYEIDKGRWIVMEDQEINKKIAPPSTDTMEIQQFVKLSDVDPLYFDASYYAIPEDPGRKAYKLMVETMEKVGYAAVAKVAMHQREYIVIVRPRGGGLTLHTMYYPNEVREIPEYGKTGDVEVKPQEIQLAEQLVKSLSGAFEPQRYEDEYQKRLLELVEAKGEGRALHATASGRKAPVVDLMQALQKSLAAVEKRPERKPAANAPSKKAATKQRKTA
jgi:DNA end-binding protein Ku